MRFRANPEVVWGGPDDAVRVYHAGVGEFQTLNRTGSAIWALATSGHDAATIAARLATAYELSDGEPVTALEEDVQGFLDTLVAAGLLLTEPVQD